MEMRARLYVYLQLNKKNFVPKPPLGCKSNCPPAQLFWKLKKKNLINLLKPSGNFTYHQV
jgi:hypothetical protein